MIPQIREINFGPGTVAPYATLHQATVSLTDMGERVVSTQVKIDGDVVPDFTGWEVEFRGERFVLPTRTPQAAKDNNSRCSMVDLNFYSWPIQEMKRYFFMSMAPVAAGVAVPDKYNASVLLPVEGFVDLFNQVLQYYFSGKIRMDLFQSGSGIYSTEPVAIEINHSYIWDVLQKFYELFELRWRIDYDSVQDIYIIKVNYAADVIDDHDFEYGYEGGLIRFERQVQDESIVNILLGRGGEKNLPYRYFKIRDEHNLEWEPDPDAIPELANFYFDRLRDINFRWYIRGWVKNPHRDTSADEGYNLPDYDETDVPSQYLWAYRKGRYEDVVFNPVEYVKDDESIALHGERWGMLDDNDGVYPTIQGVEHSGLGRADEVVAVSDIITDDIEAGAQNAATETNIGGLKTWSFQVNGYATRTVSLSGVSFDVPTGTNANLSGRISLSHHGAEFAEISSWKLSVYDAESKQLVGESASGVVPNIPAGSYYCLVTVSIRNNSGAIRYVDISIDSLKLLTAVVDAESWKPTFDIWVKNIFETTKDSGETDEEYAARVWEPILGDRVGNEAKIVFSDGFMSISEDYEFTIAAYPVFDQSKTLNGVQSEWKITVYKSNAEYETTGLFIPNASSGKPIAGDHFFFIGIDMPHQYVEWAEERLNGSAFTPTLNKTAELEKSKDVNPTWVIGIDKVRANTLEDGEYDATLAERLASGARVRITDERFTNGDVLTLYVQSITFTWNEPSEGSPYLVPDIEVVLSDKVVAVESAVSRLSNDISIIRTSYAKASDIESVVRRVASPLFLKKTGETDSSESPTSFGSKVSSKDFLQGDVAGTGWAMYLDGDNHWVFETDRIVARHDFSVNSLVVNQVTHAGGKQIYSAAGIECVKVDETDDGYVCYFDQKQGSIANLFQVNDIAMSQQFSPANVEERYYRRLVTEVGDYYIVLSKAQKSGSGIPQKGDVIVQYGNVSQTSRQYAIIRDVIGGGYERMVSGLNSVSATEKEYYFAGRQNGSGPRWFVGDSVGEYASWENGVLNIKGRITVRKSDGTYVQMSQFITDNDITYLKNATNQGTLIDGGLVLTSMIQLGQVEGQTYHVYSGINGIMDSQLTDPSRSIAAWYGGPMVDHEVAPSASTYAKSLFRFDGSGYLASGKITWDSAGSGQIPGIRWQGNSVYIEGSVKLRSTSGDSVTELISLVQQLNNWFGEDANGDVYVKRKAGNVARNFYSYGNVSAGGANTSGGGGVFLARVWESLTNNTDYPNTLINARHIPIGRGLSYQTVGGVERIVVSGGSGGSGISGETFSETGEVFADAMGLYDSENGEYYALPSAEAAGYVPTDHILSTNAQLESLEERVLHLEEAVFPV